MINKFTKEFLLEYCNDDGSINWEKIVKLNSEKTEPKAIDEAQEALEFPADGE